MPLRQSISRSYVDNSARAFPTSWLLSDQSDSGQGLKRRYSGWLPVFMLLLQVHTSQAQFGRAVSQTSTETDSTRGYWRVKTQAVTRNTVIQFFGLQNELLYEETLSEKYVKLSRKNQRQFDLLLAQLLSNHLLVSRISTESLPPTPDLPIPPRVTVRSNSLPQTSLTDTSYQVQAYVNQAGKLRGIVNNPERLRYVIKLIDRRKQAVYEEFTNHDRYRRSLDLSALPLETYQLIVDIENKPVTYTLNKRGGNLTYALQSLSITHPLVCDKGRIEEDKNELND